MSVQISAYIKDDIKANMERYSSSHGLKKAYLIESAIEYYLQALHELPSSVIVPSSITIDHKSYEKIMESSLKEPSDNLSKLLSQMDLTIRVLEKGDEKECFFCTEPELDTYFKKFAGQNQFKHYIGTTYIASLNDKIVGFITVNASSIRVKELKNQDTKKLPYYPLPILRISRLAVDVKYKNNGIGKELLKFILNLSVEQRDMFGCIGGICRC